jgi:hypothetical protein
MSGETEKQGTDSNAGQPDGAPAERQREPDDTVTIRKGEYSGLKKQLVEMRKQLEEFAGARDAEEKAKLKAASDWEALDRRRAEELDATKAELAAARRSVLTESARSALLGAGMSAPLTVAGALSQMPPDIDPDGIAAWVADVVKANPDAVKASSNPISAGSVGPTGKPTTDTAAALRAEWEASRSKGPDAMLVVKRKIDAHQARTGVNPLIAK